MNAGSLSETPDAPPGGFVPLEGDMVELSLLLPGWQAQALETAARDQGLTAAQMLRGLIRQFCARMRQVGAWPHAPGLDC
jgi:hypothetical protein